MENFYIEVREYSLKIKDLKKEYGYTGAVDWVAIKRAYQGRKLSRPLITKILQIASKLGRKGIVLHTQTTTWLATKLYLDFGFNVLNKEEKIGWSILKTLTNYSKSSEYKLLEKEDIYDKRNIEIELQLKQIFRNSNFNYSVWYKNGLHNVYVYYEYDTYEYEYFEEKDKIKLVEVKNKKYRRQEVINNGYVSKKRDEKK